MLTWVYESSIWRLYFRKLPRQLNLHLVVRSESCTQASPWRRSEWCSGYGFTGFTSHGKYGWVIPSSSHILFRTWDWVFISRFELSWTTNTALEPPLRPHPKLSIEMEDFGDTTKALALHLSKVSAFIAGKAGYLCNCIGPVSRFGDTAANAGILALLQSNSYLKNLPSPVKTIFASLWYYQANSSVTSQLT